MPPPPRYNPDEHKDATELDLNPPHYPWCGLYFPMAEYDAIKLREMVDWPLEKQAVYCDAISQRYCKNPRFVKPQMEASMKVQRADVKRLNSCSIGNLAVIVLNNPEDESARKVHDRVVELVRRYAKT